MKFQALGLVILLILSANTYAGGLTGNDILEDCRDLKEKNAHNEGACYGFLQGMMEGHRFSVIFFNTLAERNPETELDPGFEYEEVYCLPKNTNNGQYLRVVINYIEANPALSHRPASLLIMMALTDAFPCD